MTAPAPSWPERLGAAVVVAAFLVMALVGLAATTRLGELLSQTWSQFPGGLGWRGLGLVIGLGGVSLLVLLWVGRVNERSLRRWMPAAGLALLVGVRLLAIVALPTPIPADDDPRYLHELAVGVLDGGNPLVAHRPMGYPTLLAVLYTAFGVRPILAELLNLLFAVMAGWILYRLVAGMVDRRAGAVALTLYALVPSQVLLVTMIYTETAYAALLLGAVALAASAVRGGRLGVAVAAGAVLAASQYVRPLSQAFLAAFLVVPFVSGLRPRRAVAIAGALAVSFGVVLAPIVAYNATTHGALSLATSSYGGWSLFVGANQEHDGRFNDDDQAILAGMDGSVWERSDALGRAALDRITSDPRGYADLLVRKFRVMWADDTFAVSAALPAREVPSFVRAGVAVVSQLTYALLSVATAAALWWVRRRPPPVAVLVAGIILLVTAAHAVLEVQPRYHAYVVPLFVVLAAPVAASRYDAGGRAAAQRSAAARSIR